MSVSKKKKKIFKSLVQDSLEYWINVLRKKMIPLYSSESASKACLSGLLNTKEVLLGISSISAKTFIFFFY